MKTSTDGMKGQGEARTIGFVGLGAMGSAMARRLIEKGFVLTAYNRTSARAASLAAMGATIAATPAQAAACGLVISMLAGDEALNEVVHGEDGILAGLPEGGLHISMSTVGVALATLVASEHIAAKRRYLSAPVLGRPSLAANGETFILAAGDAVDIMRAKPTFDALARHFFHIGPQCAQANLLKLSINFLISCAVEGLGEVFALCGKNGLDRAAVLDVLTGTIFDGPVYRIYGDMIANGRFSPVGYGFPLGLKDNRLLLEAAASSEVPLPFASVVRDQVLSALASGYGNLDWAALGQVAADRAGAGGRLKQLVGKEDHRPVS